MGSKGVFILIMFGSDDLQPNRGHTEADPGWDLF